MCNFSLKSASFSCFSTLSGSPCCCACCFSALLGEALVAARPWTCVEQGRGSHAGLPGLGGAFWGRAVQDCQSPVHIAFSFLFQLGLEVMVARSWASCGWRREQRRFGGESHCQLQASSLGATAGAEAGASEDRQQQMVGWQAVVVQAVVRPWPGCSRVAVPAAQQCPGPVPISVSSCCRGLWQAATGRVFVLPAQGCLCQSSNGAWVLPSEMIWDAESLFQH